MIKNIRPRIYSKYEIRVILFYGTIILLIPLILVFTYVFNVDQDLNLNLYFLVLGSINIVALIAGTLILFLNRDKYKRQVKATYSSEFYYLLITSIFGILGIIVLYNYLNGPIKYIGNLFVILIVIFAYLLLHLGRKYFNFNYRRKK
ncbi:MAG: hypothetical protein AB7E16_00930 [Candidatus Izemoplasmatales bacterium]|jgi:nitrate reductase gamma subunit